MNRAVFALSAAFLAVVLGCQAGGATHPTGSPKGSSPPPSLPPAQSFNIGDQFQVGPSMWLTVNGVQTSKRSDNLAPLHGQFMTVSVSVGNVSSQPLDTSTQLSLQLRDQEGQSYDQAAIRNPPDPLPLEIAPNSRASGAYAYDVSTGKSFRLYCTDNLNPTRLYIVDLGQH